MAREKCKREYCWDEIVDTQYLPVANRKLLVIPDQVCFESLSKADRIKFYADLKTKYGFSLIQLYPGEGSAEAAEAGWMKNEVVLNATTHDLSGLKYAEDFWSNHYASEELKRRGINKDDPSYIQRWEYLRTLAPPFHAVFYDEPMSNPHGAHPIDIQLKNEIDVLALHRQLAEIGRNEGAFFVKLCEDPSSVYKLFNEYHNIRFFLMSMYIHMCMDTKFVVGEYNSLMRNYWRDLLLLLQNTPKTGPLGGSFNWLDAIVIGKYESEWDDIGMGSNDQSIEWETLAKTGWDGGRAIIALHADRGEYTTLFKTAARLGMHELWLFPQPAATPSWTSCSDYIKRLKEYLEAAVASGYLTKKVTYARRCIEYEIPGCRGVNIFLKDVISFP